MKKVRSAGATADRTKRVHPSASPWTARHSRTIPSPSATATRWSKSGYRLIKSSPTFEKSWIYNPFAAKKYLKKTILSGVLFYGSNWRVEMKKIYLSRTDKKIFGVCGGIGQALDIDPTLIRLVTLFLCIATGILPLLITYIAAWFIVPYEPQN